MEGDLGSNLFQATLKSLNHNLFQASLALHIETRTNDCFLYEMERWAEVG